MREWKFIASVRELSFCLAFFFFSLIGYAQNLVPNDGFDIFTACPITSNQVAFHVPPWSNVANQMGSPDYFNTCGGSPYGAPSNPMGYQQPHSGSGFVGIHPFALYPYPSLYLREYVTVPLTQPMVAGQTYSVGFYVSLANHCKFGIDALGAHISVGPLLGAGNISPLNVVPQIANPAGNLLMDTVNWMLISGLYTALGGEDYLTLGNFNSNQNTTSQVNNPNLNTIYSHYFIDDAFVIPSFYVTGNDICLGDSVTLEAIGTSQQYSWVASNAPNVVLSTDSVVTVSPQVTTSYFVYGNPFMASFTVNVQTPPSVNLGNDTSLCPGDNLALYASNPGATYLWQNNATNSTFNVHQQGTYWVLCTVGLCSNSDTIHVSYVPPPPINLGPDTLLCPGSGLLLDAASDGASYLWQDNSTDSSLFVAQAGTYSVQIVSPLGCINSDTIHIDYIPAFSLDLGPDLSLCLGQSVTLDASAVGVNYLWHDGVTTAQFQVVETGTYFVEVSNSCTTLKDTVYVDYFDPGPNFLGNDTILCQGSNLILNVDLPNTQTTWQDQSVSTTFEVSHPGNFMATTISPEGCVATDQITVDYIQIPRVDLGPDLRICELHQHMLENVDGSTGDYLWSTGSQMEQIYIDAHGTYFLEVGNQCGTRVDTISIVDNGCCWVYVPNTFTPDGDENNNGFGPKFDCSFTEFQLTIYNRWGQMLWESNDPAMLWDGTFHQEKMPSSSYMYRLKYSNEHVFDEIVMGHFILLR